MTKITIIDDSEEAQRRFLASLPVAAGFELQPISVEPFFDEKIERAIAEFDPDLILLDLRLSRDEQSGFRVLRKLKTSELLRDVPVVVCSLSVSRAPADSNRRKALEYGAQSALHKIPFPEPDQYLRYARARAG